MVLVAASTSTPSKAALCKMTQVAAPPPRVTKVELGRHYEEKRLRLEHEVEAAKKRAVGVADKEYECVVLNANTRSAKEISRRCPSSIRRWP